jgi:hypothetical protein
MTAASRDVPLLLRGFGESVVMGVDMDSSILRVAIAAMSPLLGSMTVSVLFVHYC